MEQSGSHEVTQLLLQWSDGDQNALRKLFPAVYRELRRLAASRLRHERPWHTLQTSALVNEAYLRLVNQNRVQWRDRAHFFAIAAQMMRRILVDHARGQQRAKRGGAAPQLSLDALPHLADERSPDLVALDDALKALAEMDPQKSRVVELRFFGGLTSEEIGEVLGVSTATVTRHWRMAKAWLYRSLTASDM